MRYALRTTHWPEACFQHSNKLKNTRDTGVKAAGFAVLSNQFLLIAFQILLLISHFLLAIYLYVGRHPPTVGVCVKGMNSTKSMVSYKNDSHLSTQTGTKGFVTPNRWSKLQNWLLIIFPPSFSRLKLSNDSFLPRYSHVIPMLFPWKIPMENSHGKFPWKIPMENSHVIPPFLEPQRDTGDTGALPRKWRRWFADSFWTLQ